MLNLFTLRNGIIAAVICLMPFLTNAQISGKIVDANTDAGIEGAVVSVNGTFLQAVTEADGSFSIPTANDTVITITHIAYQLLTTGFHGSNVIKLNKRTYISEEVTISASRADKKSAVAYTDVSKADIEKINHGQDFPFLLSSLPSVVVTSDGGAGVGYTGIRIRGSDATRVNVTINGIPVNDPESHQVYWVDLPDIASSVENVQVQRGLGNSTSGAGAFGASINVLTNKLNDKPYATVASSAGSFNTFKNTVMFGSGLLSNAFAVEGRLSKITSNGYIDRASSDLKSMYLSAGYYGKKNSLRFVTFTGKERTYQAWYGVPQDSLKTNRTYNPAGEYYDAAGNVHYYGDQTDNYQQDYYQLLYSHAFSDKLILNTALHYTYGRGYYEEYKQDADLADYHLGDSILTNADLIRRLWLSNNFYGAMASLEYTKQRMKIQGGFAANYYEGDHFGQVIASDALPASQYPFEYYNDWAYKTDVSAFVKAVYSLSSRTDLTVDLQERHVEYSYLGLNDNFENARINKTLNFFNPKAGVNYSPAQNLQFYIYGGIGHKEPVRDDYVNASPTDTISPEKMIDAEAGMKIKTRKGSYGINFYYMYYDNQLILTGKINDVGEYIRQNVPQSYRSGVEAEGEMKITSQLYAKANATFSMNKINNYKEYVDDYDGGPQVINEYKNTPISFSPTITGYAALGINILKGLNAELSGKYVSKQYLDNTGNDSRSIDPYLVSDLHLSYTMSPGKIKEMVFSLSLMNLANTEYSSNGYSYSGYSAGMRSDYNYYFPQAKMNVMGGVTIKF